MTKPQWDKKTVQDNTGMARCLVQEVCLDGHISQGWHSFLACMYHSAVATVWYCNLWTFQSSSEWGPRQVASVWLADFNNNKCVGLLVDFVGTYFDRWEKKNIEPNLKAKNVVITAEWIGNPCGVQRSLSALAKEILGEAGSSFVPKQILVLKQFVGWKKKVLKLYPRLSTDRFTSIFMFDGCSAPSMDCGILYAILSR